MGHHQEEEFERWPKYKELYLTAFGKMLEENKKKGITHKANWDTAEDVMDWWID